jgi:hypothetical protein
MIYNRPLLLAAGAFVGSVWLANLLRRAKSSRPGAAETLELEVIDFQAFFNKDKDPERFRAECEKVRAARRCVAVWFVV